MGVAVAGLLVMVVVVLMMVVHRVQVVNGLLRGCGVTVLVDVVGREGGQAVRVVQGLMLLGSYLVARIYGDTYEPAGQDVAVAVDHVNVGG